MAGVWVERNISHDAQVGKVLFKSRDHMGNQTYGVRCFFAIRRFKVATDDGKERHDRNAELHTFFGDVQQQVQAHTINPRHRRHRFAAFFAFKHEDGIDQIVYAQGMFAYQAAGEVIATKTARAAKWKWCRHEMSLINKLLFK